jgi:hypothetical protein
MRARNRPYLLKPMLLLLIPPLLAVHTGWAGQPYSSWVYPEVTGQLQYRADAQGDTIPDFSRAGYHHGGPLPEVPTLVNLSPRQPGDMADDTERIQLALDEVGARLARENLGVGALNLRAGIWRVAGQLVLRHDGLVLRGEGSGSEGTQVIATGPDRRSLIMMGAADEQRRELPDSRRLVTADYVPSSARFLPLDSTIGYEPGQRVVVYRPGTAEWIKAIGMDRIPVDPRNPNRPLHQWPAEAYDLHFERVVTSVSAEGVELDAPIMMALDRRYGGGEVYRYTATRVKEVGVADLLMVSAYDPTDNEDEDHAWFGITIGAAENAWVRGVLMRHFVHGVRISPAALYSTVEHSRHEAPVSRITGGRRYAFALHGQYGLVRECEADHTRHAFSTSSRVRGPNVFLHCTATNSHNDSGPHHRWAVGTLYDNVEDDKLNVQNRLWSGSGHGWAGAQQVFWNCRVEEFRVQRPPTAQNYVIGGSGRLMRGLWSPDEPDGVFEQVGVMVEPRSLYLAQRAERLALTRP